MEISTLLYLTSGLFLGWALGANHLGNIFGTAVGTRMVSFAAAAFICSVFVILGAVISGAGAAHTLGELGAVNALAGSFMVALAAGISIFIMTKLGLPVSSTQAIVGAIIGWNLFCGLATDPEPLIKILGAWVASPVLAAAFSIVLFKSLTWWLRVFPVPIVRLDALLRIGLIVAGAFGAYSLGANNIANVMGVFIASSPFTDTSIMGGATFTSVQQLFLIGAMAIAAGVITYSKRVVHTVGSQLLKMSPLAAWVVVMAHSLVLFVFASEGLERFLADHGLSTIPLVPVSSSEAVIGAVVGIALLQGGRGMHWKELGGISLGWVLTPFISMLVCFVGLFFLQNVFNQQVYTPAPYTLSDTAPFRPLGPLAPSPWRRPVDAQEL